MSTIRLKTKNELEKFLRVLAEESVNTAQHVMAAAGDEKRRQAQMSKDIDKAKNLFEEDPEAGASAAPDTTPEPETPEPAAEKPAEKEAPTQGDKPSDINPTLDSLMRAINELRSGFGTSDSAIENELSLYFDRLENAERVSLIVMLRSIGDIMRKEASGNDASEPSQYDVMMSMKPKDKEQSAAASAPAPAAASASPPAGGTEDTSPPIKVGEPVSEAYRARIRDLLMRAQA